MLLCDDGPPACCHLLMCCDASSLLIFVTELRGWRRPQHAGQSRCSKAASLEILDLSEGEALELLCKRNIPSKAAIEVIHMSLFFKTKCGLLYL